MQMPRRKRDLEVKTVITVDMTYMLRLRFRFLMQEVSKGTFRYLDLEVRRDMGSEY